MKKLLVVGCCLLAFSLTSTNAMAASATYVLNATGDQEVPGPGDPDGLATGLITLDDVTGSISWSFDYFDIAEPTAMHIHGPGGSAGSSAGVAVGLGVAGASGTSGTLADSIVAPTADVASILANPLDFYVNIHNQDFGPGAIRGQLGTLVPEPTSLVLLTLAATALTARRQRA